MVSALTEHGADETLAALEMGAVDFVAKPQGTISLHADEFAPFILERVRTAAEIKIRRSARLADRLRFNSGAKTARPPSGRIARRPLAERPSLPADVLVLVGASTGGPPALDALLSSLPANFGWPILIAQHMPATFTASFARRLDALCQLPVVEVTAPTSVEGGTIYIGRGDADMLVGKRAGGLMVMPAPSSPDHRWHPSVDRLVASAMMHWSAKNLVGILLTGMGNDGATAMTELKLAGGHTIAEAEETAVVWGMPGDLVRRNGATDVVGLPQIADRLLELSPWR
jgi:two-component system chemotaxis response regulator CheB